MLSPGRPALLTCRLTGRLTRRLNRRLTCTLVLVVGGALAVVAAPGPAYASVPGTTPSSSSVTSLQGAPSAFIGEHEDPAATIVLDLPNTRWAAGDRVQLTLPAGYTFSQLPHVAVSPVAAAGTVYAPQVVASWVDATTKTGVWVTFTDSAPASATTADLDLGLVVADQGINVPASVTPGPVLESVQGQSAGTPGLADYGSVAIATASHYIVFSPQEASGVPTSGPPATVTLGVDEAQPTDLADGTYTLTLSGATVTDVTGATLSPDSEEEGSHVTLGAGGIHTVPGDPHSVTLDLASTSATVNDGFILDGIHVTATQAGPVTATLSAVPDGASALGASPVTTARSNFEGAYGPLTRLGGANRYATAAAIADALATSATDTVILASGGQGSADGVSIDALAASYLAGAQAHRTPILLTAAGALPPETADAIRQVLPHGGKVVILGGTTAVSDVVAGQVSALSQSAGMSGQPATGTYTVSRIVGGNRFESAANAALAAAALRPVGTYSDTAATAPVPTAILASGLAPVDALGAGQVSAAAGLPLLLTGQGQVPDPTMTALAQLKVRRVIVLGGTSVVAPAVIAQLTAAGLVVTRLAGTNRYGTETALLDRMAGGRADDSGASAPYGVDDGLSGANGTAYLASGTALADASVAGPLAAATGRPLLLTPAGSLGDEALGEFVTLQVRQVVGIGQATALSGAALAQANLYANLD